MANRLGRWGLIGATLMVAAYGLSACAFLQCTRENGCITDAGEKSFAAFDRDGGGDRDDADRSGGDESGDDGASGGDAGGNDNGHGGGDYSPPGDDGPGDYSPPDAS